MKERVNHEAEREQRRQFIREKAQRIMDSFQDSEFFNSDQFKGEFPLEALSDQPFTLTEADRQIVLEALGVSGAIDRGSEPLHRFSHDLPKDNYDDSIWDTNIPYLRYIKRFRRHPAHKDEELFQIDHYKISGIKRKIKESEKSYKDKLCHEIAT